MSRQDAFWLDESLMRMMSLVLGLSGLVLLRLHLLMLFVLVVVLSPLGAWFLAVGAPYCGLFD